LGHSAKKLTIDDITIRLSDKDIERYSKVPEAYDIIGQPRALGALTLGTEIKARGYNIFATGLAGTGKRTAIRKILKSIKPDHAKLTDIALVYNFKKPDNPIALVFPKSKAKEFKKDIHRLVEDLKHSIKGRLEGKRFQTKKDRVVKSTEDRENKILSEFESRLAKENFQIVQMGEGDDQVTDILPVHKGKAMDFEELQALVVAEEIADEYWNTTREKYFGFMDEMKRMFKDLREYRNEMDEKIQDIGIREVKPVVTSEIEKLKVKYKDKRIAEYCDDLGDDIFDNLYLFSGRQGHNKDGKSLLVRYGVNIIVDHSDTENLPIIFEHHPTYQNLFGSIESKVELGGEIRTNFMMIRAGSLIQATGGFLVLNADDILRDEFSWQSLKSALMSEKVEIQQVEGSVLIPGMKIKPEPICIDVKVIVIGDPRLYDFLYSTDDEFQKLFKVHAEFDSVIEWNDSNLAKYVQFIHRCVQEHGLKPITTGGVRAVVEHGMRLAEQTDSLTTRFSQISDTIKEADYWAGKLDKHSIDEDAVRKAIDEKDYRCNLPEEKLQKLITNGDIILAIDGAAVGKINGLAVYDRGYYAFGRPTLITARVSPGDNGIVNVEREAGLSGETHDKGVLILEGFLRSKYAMDFPLSITASVCFEQSYMLIEGDSASSSEVYALLSAISGIPLRQDIAVTGSVNQMGEIQPIGGVTEKVEGFFKVCSLLNFTGSQGVIIPCQNVKNLILSQDVKNAVADGKFHIYSVTTIDEGIEILTGMKAGERGADLQYPEKTINFIVQQRLRDMALMVKDYGA
jgi:predicted ATP-dependent protease